MLNCDSEHWSHRAAYWSKAIRLWLWQFFVLSSQYFYDVCRSPESWGMQSKCCCMNKQSETWQEGILACSFSPVLREKRGEQGKMLNSQQGKEPMTSSDILFKTHFAHKNTKLSWLKMFCCKHAETKEKKNTSHWYADSCQGTSIFTVTFTMLKPLRNPIALYSFGWNKSVVCLASIVWEGWNWKHISVIWHDLRWMENSTVLFFFKRGGDHYQCSRFEINRGISQV